MVVGWNGWRQHTLTQSGKYYRIIWNPSYWPKRRKWVILPNLMLKRPITVGACQEATVSANSYNHPWETKGVSLGYPAVTKVTVTPLCSGSLTSTLNRFTQMLAHSCCLLAMWFFFPPPTYRCFGESPCEGNLEWKTRVVMARICWAEAWQLPHLRFLFSLALIPPVRGWMNRATYFNLLMIQLPQLQMGDFPTLWICYES